MCMEVVMRTNIDIDEKLLEAAFSVSQVRSKKDLIHTILKPMRTHGGMQQGFISNLENMALP